MKQIQPLFYFLGSVLLPVVALAHGDGDGHDAPVDVPHPEQRIQVLAVVVGVFLLMGLFVWYSRRKNAPPPTTPA